ncbi:MAG: helix-turn-helix domain-containing protein [Candidatus Thermoplasmatota archaeon]
MNHEIAISLLSSATYGTFTTGELIRQTGHSPTTVVRYLRELTERGWIERTPAGRLGPGRPPVVNRPTEEGRRYLRQAERAWFQKLVGSGAQVLWGPVRAFAFWGAPFVGRPDVFVSEPLAVEPFEAILEPSPAMYEGAVRTDEGAYPSLESLIAWAAKSGDPRYAAVAAVLLRHRDLDADGLRQRSERMRVRNRVGFLAALVGRDLGLSPAEASERMLPAPAHVDAEAEDLARRWRVTNPISSGTVRNLERLYGGVD